MSQQYPTPADLIEDLASPSLLMVRGKNLPVVVKAADFPRARTRIIKQADDTFVIEISYGMFWALCDATNQVLLSKEVFPGIGSIEELDGGTRSVSVRNRFVDYRSEKDPEVTTFPSDNRRLVGDRIDLSDLVLEQAFRFLMLHEQGHLLRRHFECLEALGRMSDYEESVSGADRTREYLTLRKAMEIDADRAALYYLFELVESLEDDPIGRRRYRFAKSPDALMIANSIGIAICFAILEANDAALNSNSGERAHPMALTRVVAAMNFLKTSRADGLLERRRFDQADSMWEFSMKALEILGLISSLEDIEMRLSRGMCELTDLLPEIDRLNALIATIGE